MREVEAGRVAQLYVIVEVDEGAHERVEAALGTAGIACLLLAPPAGSALAADRIKPLVEAVQARQVAALIADDIELARTVRADGVHLGPGRASGGGLRAGALRARRSRHRRRRRGHLQARCHDLGRGRRRLHCLRRTRSPQGSRQGPRAGAMSSLPGGGRSSRCPASRSTSKPGARRRRSLERARISSPSAWPRESRLLPRVSC